MSDIKQQNLTKAVAKLEAALAADKTDIVRDSCIKRYEICYELAWKAVQEYLKNQGMEVCNTPKSCFKQAFRLGLIANEPLFSEMVKNRNLTSHTYDEDLADKIYSELHGYTQELAKFIKCMSKNPYNLE